MENATKALLIAGSILIVIIIIGFGVLIVNSGDGMSKEAEKTLDEMEIKAFNSKFTAYEGTQSASQVKSLYDTVSASNKANGASSNADLKYVHFDEENSVARKDLSSTKKYTVTCDDVDPEDGLIDTITVKEAK